MREALQHELLQGASPAERVRRRLEQTGDVGMLEALAADEVAALHELPRHVSQGQLDAAARLLLDADHVHLFGRANATVLVELLHRRLRRFGLRSSALPMSGRDLSEHLVTLQERDVVVVFAFLRPPRHLSALLQHAAATGARPLPALYGTFAILVAGAAYTLPFAAQSGRSAVSQITRDLEESAVVAGAGLLRRLGRIIVPLSARGLLAGAVLVFVNMVRDLSLVLLLVTPATPLLAVLTYRYASEGFTQFANANAITVIIAAISIAATVLARRLQGAARPWGER